MKIIDTHIHFGNQKSCENIVQNSLYRNVYKLYNSVNVTALSSFDDYVKNLDSFIVMPMVFKETDINEANNDIINYFNDNLRAVPVLLVPNDKDFDNNFRIMKYNILKEHFLVHDYNDYKDRSLGYQYLSDNQGFLILHPLSTISKQYIETLRSEYPNMNIIVAHLGRNGQCDEQFTKDMIDFESKDDRIYTDISTISNKGLIKYAVDRYGEDRIFFGSDYPYFSNDIPPVEEQVLILQNIDLSDEQRDKILYSNAKKMIKKLRIR